MFPCRCAQVGPGRVERDIHGLDAMLALKLGRKAAYIGLISWICHDILEIACSQSI